MQYDAGLKTDAHGNFEGHTAAGDKVVTDGNVKNYRRASDRLKEVGRRREEASCGGEGFGRFRRGLGVGIDRNVRRGG